MRIQPINIGQRKNNQNQTNNVRFKSREERELFEYIVEKGIKEKTPIKAIFKELAEDFDGLFKGFSKIDENNFTILRDKDNLRISMKDGDIACSNSVVTSSGRKRHYIEYSTEGEQISKSFRMEYPSNQQQQRVFDKDTYLFNQKENDFEYISSESKTHIPIPKNTPSIINQFKAKYYS